MNNKHKLILAIWLGLCVMGTNLVFAQQSEQKFQGFNLQGYTDEGEKSWDVVGETANVNGTKINLTNVDANSYGDRQMNIKAKEGEVDQTSGEMKLAKDVVITSQDGAQLKTESLNWNKNKDLVTTQDDVEISDKVYTATGKGMKAHPGLKTAQINEDVSVDINPASKSTKPVKKVTITSDGPMMIDQLLKKARFEKNVVAIQENQTLKADVMEIYFDEKMSAINELICMGNVEIIQGENKSFAEKVTYNVNDQKIVLSGRPKLIFDTQGNDAFKPLGD